MQRTKQERSHVAQVRNHSNPVGAAEGCEAFILTYRDRSLRQLLQMNALLTAPAPPAND